MSKNEAMAKAESKKRFFFVIVGIAILLASGVFVSVKIYEYRTTSVLFYNLPENARQILTDQITAERASGIKFTAFAANKVPTSRITKRFDLVFFWNDGKIVSLTDKAIPIDARLYNAMPGAIAKAGIVGGQPKALPILLDHYELAFYTTYRDAAGLRIPETLSGLENYLRAEKQFAEFPFICTGSDDRTLLALISALTDSLGGVSAYEALVDAIRKNPSLDSAMDARLSDTVTLRVVLDKLRTWKQDGLIMPFWYELRETDIDAYMDNHLTAVVFMPLGAHRTKRFEIIKYYEATRFPIGNDDADHALVAPVLSGMLFRNTAGEQDILESLLSNKIQERLSGQTMLAPVASRAEANDRQADDVRFWAASCAGGPVAGLYGDAFTDETAVAGFARQAREYLGK